jgi:hypothetical protein
LPNYFSLLKENNFFEEKDIRTIYTELQTVLTFFKIKATICDIYAIKESGVFLYNDSFKNYNFVLCNFNSIANDYKFFHFENSMSFYSSKSTLDDVLKRICLIISV